MANPNPCVDMLRGIVNETYNNPDAQAAQQAAEDAISYFRAKLYNNAYLATCGSIPDDPNVDCVISRWVGAKIVNHPCSKDGTDEFVFTVASNLNGFAVTLIYFRDLNPRMGVVEIKSADNPNLRWCEPFQVAWGSYASYKPVGPVAGTS